ncbi:hypothetical protein ACN28E_48345 [Archangium lansingense]|uniref:hypothetical protein n=1 Tax=Archangium lansingense TaxID=2995310 RepID=UPI003B7C378F
MRKTGMKLVLLGAFAGAALLAGCSNPYDYGRKGSLVAQDDYYSEQTQQGTGGAGEADAKPADNESSKQAQSNLWLKQDMRVPYPPPQLDGLVALELGTGKPLRVGPNGAWVEGTRGVELGSGLATSVSTSGSSIEPQEQPTGAPSLPNEPSGEGQQAPKGQIGQPPAPDDQ